MSITKSRLFVLTAMVLTSLGLSMTSQTEDCDEACQAIRKAQDPLADVKAVMTDNTIALGTADDQTSSGFQIQPVYSIPTDLLSDTNH